MKAWRIGWEDGYRRGWSYGYHLGKCEAIVRQSMEVKGRYWDVKVLFVPAQGAPYASLDQGIGRELEGLVQQLRIADNHQDAVVLAAEFRPDLVIVLDALGQTFPAHKADELRAMGIRTAVWLPDDPYHSDVTVGIAPHYDYVFTLEMSCVSLYRELGCKQVYYLPFAVNPNYIRPIYTETAYETDVCFIGSAFWNRVALFDEIAEYLAGKKVKIVGYWWERLKHYSLLKDKIDGIWLSPEETLKHYNRAKIVINLHRSSEDPSHNSNSRNLPARSVNPRMFEISACGTLQLSDVREGLPDLYTPEYEMATFSSPDELVNKIEYYLHHEDERREMAWRGLQKTMREHTFRNRLSELLSIVFD
ncbi:glycosyltransferase [Paenibacillus sp. J2TS4]|uniref:CgeB family protein n=1 Tax=Paenibacillus sp. J2TS4 TaxID=2807194 RepID=UPI001B114589|nr:glycosyltransferase [Paenibacillus sp. J2TS4]GIP31274.1 spore maturation protein [Paenibacillus sp. J2TS4]